MERRTFLKGLAVAAAMPFVRSTVDVKAAFGVEARAIHSTMGALTAGDGSPNPLDHSWWYTPLDFVGRAPTAPDSARRIDNVNAWLASYSTESRRYVNRFLLMPNGGNSIPIYYGAATDPVVDWGNGVSMHTPSDCPRPGSVGAGTRSGHLILYDPSRAMGTAGDGHAVGVVELASKGIVEGIFDGTSGNWAPRGRTPWAKSLMRREFERTGGFGHRIGMGWPDGNKQDRDTFGNGSDALRTKEFAWPLTANDGGGIYAIEGQVFRIKPEVDLEAFTWVDPIAHAVARTMQTYGAVVLDGEGPFTGGPLLDGYGKRSLEVVSNVPVTPDAWEFVTAGYDPRVGVTR